MNKPIKIFLTTFALLVGVLATNSANSLLNFVNASTSYLKANNDYINLSIIEAVPIDLISNDSYSNPSATNIESINGIKLTYAPNTQQVITLRDDAKIYAFFDYLGVLKMQVTSTSTNSQFLSFNYVLKDYHLGTTSTAMVHIYIRPRAYTDDITLNNIIKTKTVNLLANDKGDNISLYTFNKKSIPLGGFITTQIKNDKGVIIGNAKAYSNGIVEYTTMSNASMIYEVPYTIRNEYYITGSGVLKVINEM